MTRLDEICSLNMGQSPDSSSYNEIGDGLPFFQGNADFGALHPNVRIGCNAPTKIAHSGDILISIRAPIGALNIANKVDELNSKGTGSTFKAISKNVLGGTEILVEEINMSLKGILSKSKLEEKSFIVPPMELQEQFAAFVEQTNKSKSAVQQALGEVQVLFDSLM